MKIYYYCYYYFVGKICYTRPIQVERQLICVQVSVFPLVYTFLFIYKFRKIKYHNNGSMGESNNCYLVLNY